MEVERYLGKRSDDVERFGGTDVRGDSF